MWNPRSGRAFSLTACIGISVACGLFGASGVAAGPIPAPKVDAPLAAKSELRTAVFAAGCFWCVEAVFEAVEGVTEVVSGFAGDGPDNAKYQIVGSGQTKHAESVKVTYDASKISYGQLLQVLFVTSEPTVKDKQGPDAGTQYRFAIFPDAEEQRSIAESYIRQLTDAKVYSSPIVVTVEKYQGFFPAEAYHQDFVRLHPEHPYVRTWSVKRVHQLEAALPQRLKVKSPPAAAASAPAGVH